jgi:hypothetical protein
VRRRRNVGGLRCSVRQRSGVGWRCSAGQGRRNVRRRRGMGGGGWVARGGAAAQPGGGGAARCSWRRSERGVHMWERARQRKMDPKKRIGPQKMVVPLKIALYQISLSLSTITLQH